MTLTIRHIDKQTCYIDKEYMHVSCSKKTADITCDIKCDECNFRQKYKGKEERYFLYTKWTGMVNKNRLK